MKNIFMSLDTLIDRIKVLATHTNQSSSTKKPSQELIKQVLHCNLEKETEYTTPKNVCFRE